MPCARIPTSPSHELTSVIAISGEKPWPFNLLIEVQADHRLYSYRPKSDFRLTRSLLSWLLVEVNSAAGIRADRIRMFLQGASIVRYANAQLPAYKDKKSFFLVAVYIYEDGRAERSILYQNEKDSTNTVCYHIHSPASMTTELL